MINMSSSVHKSDCLEDLSQLIFSSILRNDIYQGMAPTGTKAPFVSLLLFSKCGTFVLDYHDMAIAYPSVLSQ
jgi:hypothetical protein